MLEGIFHDDIHNNATCLFPSPSYRYIQEYSGWLVGFNERHKSERFDQLLLKPTLKLRTLKLVQLTLTKPNFPNLSHRGIQYLEANMATIRLSTNRSNAIRPVRDRSAPNEVSPPLLAPS